LVFNKIDLVETMPSEEKIMEMTEIELQESDFKDFDALSEAYEKKTGIQPVFMAAGSGKNIEEFREKGKAQIVPAINIGGASAGGFVGHAVNSEGKAVQFSVESNKEFKTAALPANNLINKVEEGEMFQELPNSESINSFLIQPSEGNSMYYLFDMESQQPVLVEAPKKSTPQQVKQIMRTSPENVTNYIELSTNAKDIIFKDTNAGRLLSK